jgi:hypothetical protein
MFGGSWLGGIRPDRAGLGTIQVAKPQCLMHQILALVYGIRAQQLMIRTTADPGHRGEKV